MRNTTRHLKRVDDCGLVFSQNFQGSPIGRTVWATNVMQGNSAFRQNLLEQHRESLHLPQTFCDGSLDTLTSVKPRSLCTGWLNPHLPATNLNYPFVTVFDPWQRIRFGLLKSFLSGSLTRKRWRTYKTLLRKELLRGKLCCMGLEFSTIRSAACPPLWGKWSCSWGWTTYPIKWSCSQKDSNPHPSKW